MLRSCKWPCQQFQKDSEGMGVVPGERMEGRVDEPEDDTAAE